MKIVVLHSPDALEPPIDPVLDQLASALSAAGHETERIAANPDVQQVVASLHGAKPDLIVNLAESFAGKSALESNVAALLNLLDYRYTGSSPAGLLLAGDKILAKKVLRFHGVQTPEFVTMYRGAVDWADSVRFPVIVKPPQEDASIGITTKSVVHDLKELFSRIDALQTEYQQPVLVEQYIEGREFYVGVLGNANAEALPVIELDYSGFPEGRPRIASWEAKWGDEGSGHGEEFAGTKSVFPTELDADLAHRMQEVAIEAFHALRLRDYGRIDLRVSTDREIYVIEVNPNCYLERESEFARAARQHGIEYEALVARIVDLAAARYAR
jgi:D-alanine-D-alanine ligase